jgi:hypothetical protein
VVALLAATLVAFFVTERLKLERSPVQGTQVTPAFSPVCDCNTTEARISFRLRRAETVTADVVTRGGRAVRGLLVAQRLSRGLHAFTWNGRDDSGALARDGVYRIRLRLARGRTITIPNAIELDTAAPVVRTTAPVRPRVFSPDGDRHSDGVKVAYRLSEPGQALLYVDGKLVVRSHATVTTGQVSWYGKTHGHAYAPGRYRVALGARDLAGNPARVASVAIVRLRFVALARRRYRAAPGRRFTVRVSADAPRVAWRLGRRHGVGGRMLRLRAPAAPGRYRLVVRVRGHEAVARVVVGA